jgi:hypothetical protein
MWGIALSIGTSGLVGVVVGGTITFGTQLLTVRQQRKAELKNDRITAYERLLARGGSTLLFAGNLRTAMKARESVFESGDLSLRLRWPVDMNDLLAVSAHVGKAPDPMEIGALLFKHYDPLLEAQTAVWAKGSRASIPLANALVNACIAVMTHATERGAGRGRLATHLRGHRWTEEQEQVFSDAIEALGEARRKLAVQVRHEGGVADDEL